VRFFSYERGEVDMRRAPMKKESEEEWDGGEVGGDWVGLGRRRVRSFRVF
jgi:hypothetical protein